MRNRRGRVAYNNRLLVLFGPDKNSLQAYLNQVKLIEPNSINFEVGGQEALFWALNFSESASEINTAIIIVESTFDPSYKITINTYCRRMVDYHLFLGKSKRYKGFAPKNTFVHRANSEPKRMDEDGNY